MLSERTRMSIKFWSGMDTKDIAQHMNLKERYVCKQTDIIIATRPRYNSK